MGRRSSQGPGHLPRCSILCPLLPHSTRVLLIACQFGGSCTDWPRPERVAFCLWAVVAQKQTRLALSAHNQPFLYLQDGRYQTDRQAMINKDQGVQQANAYTRIYTICSSQSCAHNQKNAPTRECASQLTLNLLALLLLLLLLLLLHKTTATTTTTTLSATSCSSLLGFDPSSFWGAMFLQHVCACAGVCVCSKT